MRTTVDLEPDVLAAAKEIARAENVGVGKVIARLVRQSLMQPRLPIEGGLEVPRTCTTAARAIGSRRTWKSNRPRGLARLSFREF